MASLFLILFSSQHFLSSSVSFSNGDYSALRFAPLLAGTLSLALGLCLGILMSGVLSPAIPPSVQPFFRLALPLSTGFLALSVGITHASVLALPGLRLLDKNAPSIGNTIRCIDTSALIDGRIAELAEAGFLDGPMLIPQFVLNELQTVADTADNIRRTRGRRGLDVVARLQKVSTITCRDLSCRLRRRPRGRFEIDRIGKST